MLCVCVCLFVSVGAHTWCMCIGNYEFVYAFLQVCIAVMNKMVDVNTIVTTWMAQLLVHAEVDTHWLKTSSPAMV